MSCIPLVLLMLLFVVAGCQPEEPLPEFDPKNPQAIGIILAFHHWPDEAETTAILEKTTAAGLKKTKEIPLFKIWIFAWPQWKKGIIAVEVCESLVDTPSLDYCEPDYLLGPADAK